MAVFLSPVGGAAAQFFDNSGNVLTGGKLYTYSAGTTTPVATYTTVSGNVSHANPIVMDSAGRVPSGGEIWLADSTSYKFVLKDSNDVLLATWDNIRGIGSTDSIAVTSPTIYNSFGTGSTVTFSLLSAPTNEATTMIFINGVYQQKNTYSLSGLTLTFSEAPPANSSIEVSYI